MQPVLVSPLFTLTPRPAPEQARPEDVLEPSETAEEATRRMLDAKKLSSKINYNVLAGLFDSSGAAPAADRCAPLHSVGGGCGWAGAWLPMSVFLPSAGGPRRPRLRLLAEQMGEPGWKSEGRLEVYTKSRPPGVSHMQF